MALCSEIINFIRLDSLHQSHNIAAIGHVAIMQEEIDAFFVRVDINIVNAFGVERRGAAFHAMDFIAFGQ